MQPLNNTVTDGDGTSGAVVQHPVSLAPVQSYSRNMSMVCTPEIGGRSANKMLECYLALVLEVVYCGVSIGSPWPGDTRLGRAFSEVLASIIRDTR